MNTYSVRGDKTFFWKANNYAPDQQNHIFDPNDPNNIYSVDNAIPDPNGFVDVPNAYTSTVASTTQPNGMHLFFDSSGTYTEVFTKNNAIFRITATSASDISALSRFQNTSKGVYWEFVQFGDVALGALSAATANGASGATPGSIQAMHLINDAAFTAIAAAPATRHLGVVKDFVVAGYTYDATDGEKGNRVWWSAIGDHTSWTVNATTQADYTDLPVGEVRKIVGGEYGLVFTDRSIFRMSYVGSPLVFQFDEIPGSVTTVAPASVVVADNKIFYLSSDGFRVMNVAGTESQLIDVGTVAFATQRTTATTGHEFSYFSVGVKDPSGPRIFWLCKNAFDNRQQRLFCFDYALNKWSSIQYAGGIWYLSQSVSGHSTMLKPHIALSKADNSAPYDFYYIDFSGKGSPNNFAGLSITYQLLEPFVDQLCTVLEMKPVSLKRNDLAGNLPDPAGSGTTEITVYWSTGGAVLGSGTDVGSTAMVSNYSHDPGWLSRSTGRRIGLVVRLQGRTTQSIFQGVKMRIAPRGFR